jgi:hypothetical protein
VNALPFLEELADLMADRVVARLSADLPGWVDQAGSPLGPRRHIEAVRRRVARGLGGASVVGRRYLLSPEAMAEELASVTRRASRSRSRATRTTSPRSSTWCRTPRPPEAGCDGHPDGSGP